MTVKSPVRTPLIAIAGNPNSGKTTLFNQLTGLRQKVANYPGVTVERKTGIYKAIDQKVQLLDLPGTYALSPRSEEERIASDIIQGNHLDHPPVQGVMCVADSTALERSLYLILQILESGVPCAVLLNMTDELNRRGAEIDCAKLSALLNTPVLPISATKGTGLNAVRSLLHEWSTGNEMPIKPVAHIKPSREAIAERRAKAKEICADVLRKKIEAHPWSDKVDRIVLHRVWGPLIFTGVVIVVFQAIFSWAQPLMDGIDHFFGALGSWTSHSLPPGIFNSFLSDGVIAGVGSVIVFLPQILIVFFFIAFLENSGYMARAAMVMDRFFSRVGLQGKSFLPLISSYACAVPGIMAARTIENKRDRFATILIAPFMTCSARLPVYALLISAFVPNIPVIKGVMGLRAFTLLLLYLFGFAAAMFTAFLLKSSILKSDRIPFIMDIPPYRLPTLRTILLLMWDRSKIFLRRAGTVILGTAIVLWVLTTFPRTEGPDKVQNSFAGQIGHIIEPVIKPLGFNWKIGVGLVAAQAAREVIISSLSVIYKVEEGNGNNDRLQDALKQDMTPLSAVSLMVFFVFAMQCMSTIAIVRRETGGWKIPAFMFAYMNAYAYLGSFLVFQVGKLLGFQ